MHTAMSPNSEVQTLYFGLKSLQTQNLHITYKALITDFEAVVHVLCLKVWNQSFAYDASSEPEDFKVQNPKSELLNWGSLHCAFMKK